MRRSVPTVRAWLAWQGVGFAFLALWPSYRWFGVAVWDASVDERTQIIGYAAAYLLAAGLALLLARRRGLRLGSALTAASVGLAAAYLALLITPEQPYDPGLLLFASFLIAGFMAVPLLAGRIGGPALQTGLLGATLLGAVGLTLASARPGGAASVVAETYYGTPQPIRITRYRDHVGGGRADGGGLAALRSGGFLLAHPDGRFFHLRWPDHGDSLAVRELSLRAPLNADAFDADAPPGASRRRFRVTGVALETGPGGDRVLVSHHVWHPERRCVTLRLSAIELAGPVEALSAGPDGPEPGASAVAAWSAVHDASPCLALNDGYGATPFLGQNMGGRIARLAPGRFLWTVGNASEDLLSQDAGSDFGKTLAVDLASGAVEHYTLGHRNPQGLHVDAGGAIWLTEHGPRGGDELNLLRPGGNYGWPWETHGLEYRTLAPPPFGAPADASGLIDPVYAWVPSIGVSNLIAIRDTLFRHWRGDLLVSSLRAERLYRVRVAGGRVAYAEPIEIGERIRDLAEGADGRIVLWTDERTIVSLRPLESAFDGTALLAECFECHPAGDGRGGTAPDLRGVFGRPIASLPGYDYSDALRAWAGRWTGNRLHRYLADPQDVVPGTSMDAPAIRDSARRAAVVDALTRFR